MKRFLFGRKTVVEETNPAVAAGNGRLRVRFCMEVLVVVQQRLCTAGIRAVLQAGSSWFSVSDLSEGR